LATLNAYRALAAQAPVQDDPAASADCRLHARYIVETNTLQHREDSASPWYTAAGDRAARESDLAAGPGPTAERAAVEIWLTAPFHALPLVSPRLATAGYGAYTKPQAGAFGWGGCLNVIRGQTNRPAATRYPVRWPAAGGLQPFLTGAIRGEYPDPVGTCGYAYPVGGFVLLQLAEPVRAGTRGALATAGGAGLESCVYDGNTFTNPDPAAQATGRAVLTGYNAIVLVPRRPLTPFTDYRVTIGANGTDTSWDFRTEADQLSPAPAPSPSPSATPAPDSLRCFAPQTTYCIAGPFRAQWEAQGGLALNGYPLSDVFRQRLEDGEEYDVQYFERVRMELHRDGQGRPLVLLGQFGRRLHPPDPPAAPQPDAIYFAETQHNLGGAFLAYWQANGGLAQFGFPLTEVFTETLEDGNAYPVQYFERARFEDHGGAVLLGQFGRRILDGTPR
jgi:hypothetical protein